jgi:transcriptional regulator with XRE-family HTH domain
MILSKFKERFQLLRKESKKTQAAIADELGMTPQTLSYYANGREPNYDTLIKIADYFNVSLDYLLGRSDNKYPPDKVRSTSMENELLSYIQNELNSIFIKYNKLKVRDSLDLILCSTITYWFKEILEIHNELIDRINNINNITNVDEIEKFRQEFLVSISRISFTEKVDDKNITFEEIARCLFLALIDLSPIYKEYWVNIIKKVDLKG